MSTFEKKIVQLARTFPTLEKAPLEPWDAQAFDAWALQQAGSGLLHAARFVLAVWACRYPWQIGPFDAVSAIAAWDAAHRGAFVQWCTVPWWH